jgi:hypothetical protein
MLSLQQGLNTFRSYEWKKKSKSHGLKLFVYLMVYSNQSLPNYLLRALINATFTLTKLPHVHTLFYDWVNESRWHVCECILCSERGSIQI